MNTSNNNPELFQEIKRSLDAISDPGKIRMLSRIEADLIRERLRSLYDLLSGIGEMEKNVEKKVESEPAHGREISPAVIEENIQKSETDPVEIDSEELLSIRSAQRESPAKPAKQKEQPDLFSLDDGVKKGQKKTIADSISEEKQSESVADKLHKQSRVNNLKNAIGINEKFFFINELFEGNLNEYNAAIESLEMMETMDACMGYLETLSAQYNWKGHSEAMEQLLQFLERKFKQ